MANINGMKQEIRRLIEPITKFECQCCGKQVKRGPKFEYRHPQFIRDHIADLMTVCRVCVYKLSFGSKGSMIRKRTNQVEKESYLYEGRD